VPPLPQAGPWSAASYQWWALALVWAASRPPASLQGVWATDAGPPPEAGTPPGGQAYKGVCF
jgi:hypothetical protein